MRITLALVALLCSTAVMAQTSPPPANSPPPAGAPPTVGGQPLVQVKPRSAKAAPAPKESGQPKSIAKRLQACLEIDDFIPTGRSFHTYIDPCRDMPIERFDQITEARIAQRQVVQRRIGSIAAIPVLFRPAPPGAIRVGEIAASAVQFLDQIGIAEVNDYMTTIYTDLRYVITDLTASNITNVTMGGGGVYGFELSDVSFTSDSVTVTPTSAATATSQVGSYPILATVTGADASKYTVAINPGALSIHKAPLHVEAKNAGTITDTGAGSFNIGNFTNRGTLAATEGELARFAIVRVHRTRLANLDRVSGVDFKPSGDFELTFDNIGDLFMDVMVFGGGVAFFDIPEYE